MRFADMDEWGFIRVGFSGSFEMEFVEIVMLRSVGVGLWCCSVKVAPFVDADVTLSQPLFGVFCPCRCSRVLFPFLSLPYVRSLSPRCLSF